MPFYETILLDIDCTLDSLHGDAVAGMYATAQNTDDGYYTICVPHDGKNQNIHDCFFDSYYNARGIKLVDMTELSAAEYAYYNVEMYCGHTTDYVSLGNRFGVRELSRAYDVDNLHNMVYLRILKIIEYY